MNEAMKEKSDQERLQLHMQMRCKIYQEISTENVLLVNERSDGGEGEVRRIVEAISIFSLMLTHQGNLIKFSPPP